MVAWGDDVKQTGCKAKKVIRLTLVVRLRRLFGLTVMQGTECAG